MIRLIEIVSGAWNVIIAMMILICSVIMHYKEKWNTMIRVFVGLLLCNVFFQLSDMLAWIFRGDTSSLGYYMVRISNFVFFIGMAVIPFAFSMLLGHFIKESEHISVKYFLRTQFVNCAVMLLFTLTNCFTGFLYKFDEYNQYYRSDGPWLYIYNIFCYASIIIIHCYAWKYRKCKNSVGCRMIRITSILVEISALYQLFFYGISALTVAVTAGNLLIFSGSLLERSNTLTLERKKVEESLEKLEESREKLEESKEKLEESKEKLEESRHKLAETRQQMLQLQIQPHFMYNTMAAIQAQILEDQDKAYESIGTFSSFLRDTINFSRSDLMIPMTEELNFVEKFMDLAELRFGEKLNIEMDIQSIEYSVPAFTIQPLIENSLNHGLKPFDHRGTIYVRSLYRNDERGNFFVIEVEDNGVGMDPALLETLQQKEHDHIGLINVKQRIELACMGSLEVISPVSKEQLNEPFIDLPTAPQIQEEAFIRRGTMIRICIPQTIV